MTATKYPTACASARYINIAENGSVKAGMVLEDGDVLTVVLPADNITREVIRVKEANPNAHKITLRREKNRVILSSSFLGAEEVVEEFDPYSIPLGRDYWLGGKRRY